MDWKEFFMPSWKKFWIVVGLFFLYRVFFILTVLFNYGGVHNIVFYISIFISYSLNPFLFITWYFFLNFHNFFANNLLAYPIIILYHYFLACLIIFFYRKFKNRK